jgi:hypothetical protein
MADEMQFISSGKLVEAAQRISRLLGEREIPPEVIPVVLGMLIDAYSESMGLSFEEFVELAKQCEKLKRRPEDHGRN